MGLKPDWGRETGEEPLKTEARLVNVDRRLNVEPSPSAKITVYTPNKPRDGPPVGP